jgi:hypothetical protein
MIGQRIKREGSCVNYTGKLKRHGRKGDGVVRDRGRRDPGHAGLFLRCADPLDGRGGIFLLIMNIAAIVCANVRRRRAQRARLARANAAAQWWRDPAVIATGLQVGRTLGAGRALPLVLLGAFAIGLLLSRPGARSDESPGPATGS